MSSSCELYCFPCSRRFDSQDELSTHLRDHLQDKYNSAFMKLVEPYDCGKCSKAFGNQSDLYNHYAEHYFQSHFTCKSCGFICMNVSLLTLHELSCKQVNIVKITNENRESEYDKFLRESAFKQLSTSSYGTWKVVHPVNYGSTTYGADDLSTPSDPKIDSEQLHSQNDSYDARAKIHVCDICSKSFTRRCVLDAHRQKHVTEKQHIVHKNEHLQDFRKNNLSLITSENESIRISRIPHENIKLHIVRESMLSCAANETKQVQNVTEKELLQTTREDKQLRSAHEDGKHRNAWQPSKRIQGKNGKSSSSKRMPLTVVDPCLASNANKLPRKTACKRNPAKNERRSSGKKSSKRKRKYPVRKPYNLRSHLKTCEVSPVKETFQNAHKTQGSLQKGHKAPECVQKPQTAHKKSENLEKSQKAHKKSESLQNAHRTSERLQNVYKASGSMRNVVKTEDVEHPYICDACNKSFKDNFKLRRHSLIHTGVKAFACPKCHRHFSRKDHLNRHLIISSCNENATRPFSCDKCDKSFKVKWGLFKHSFVHSDKKPYNCEKCRKGFSVKYRLMRHNSSCAKKLGLLHH